MRDILKKIYQENSELINNSVISEIDREKHAWNKNIPSIPTTKNKFFESFKNKHEDDIGILFFPGPSINKTTLENLIYYIKTENPKKNIIINSVMVMFI